MKISRWVLGAALASLLVGLLGPSAQALGTSPRAEIADRGVDARMTHAAPRSAPVAAAPNIAPRIAPAGAIDVLRGPKWWSFRDRSGEALRVIQLTKGPRAGQAVVQLVIGKRYRLDGRIPASHRGELAGRQLVIEAKADARGDWKSVAEFRASSTGRFTALVRIPRSLSGVHDFRIKAPRVARSFQRATVLPGGTLSAVGNVVFSIAIYNDTASDLTFTFPTWQESSGYASGTVSVYKRTASTLTFTNPIQDITQIGFYAERFSCFLNCQVFNANWDHTPSGKYTPCSTGMPTFASGSSYTFRVTPQALTSGYDIFLLDSNGQEICTGALDTKVATWFDNHPVAKWSAIAIVGAAIAIIAWEGYVVAAELLADEEIVDIVVEAFDENDEMNCRIWNMARRSITDQACD